MHTLHLKPRYWIGHQAYPKNSPNGFAARGTRIGTIRELMRRGFTYQDAASAVDQVDEGCYVVLSRTYGVTEVQQALSV